MTGAWVSLFSGGKDSSYALFLALERGLPVERLLTVHPGADSYMFHVPATGLASLAAESTGIPLVEVEPGDLGAETAVDAGAQGDAETEHLDAALADLERDLDLAGLVVGAVESEFQATRIEGLAADRGLDVFAPLWHRDPESLAEELLAAGFEIVIVQVAAAGLDESWLGRPLDADTLAELVELNADYGVHVLGEGGEFETLVTDGPHMARPIELEFHTRWDGTRGTIEIRDAWLGDE
jgi:ABC transporter with metal-binding/Fe-S-binding domain ATP-binding protein